MQKQGLLLGFGASAENDEMNGDGSDFSEEDKQKNARKRARVNSMKPTADKIKEKLINSGSAA